MIEQQKNKGEDNMKINKKKVYRLMRENGLLKPVNVKAPLGGWTNCIKM